MKRGAIFDMDGVLFDTESLYRKAWILASEHYGKDRGKELGDAVSGSGDDFCKKTIHEFYPDVDVEEFFSYLVQTAREIIKKEIKVMAGVEEILKFFRSQKIKIAIASSSPVDVVENNLQRTNLKNYFDAIVCGNEVEHSKPEPDIFIKAAEKINLSANDCYVFEDSYNGIRGASKAGCSAVMIPDTAPPTDEMKKLCSGIYKNLHDALDAIKQKKI